MAFIDLSDNRQAGTKIMIFAEGTVLKPKSLLTLYDHKSYLPIGNAVSLITGWAEQGAEILYCTSRKGKKALELATLLCQYGFRGTALYYRAHGEQYKDLIEAVRPHILIEDDCKSIGGSWQMCITKVAPELRPSICSIIVKEFKGIDSLSADIAGLCRV